MRPVAMLASAASVLAIAAASTSGCGTTFDKVSAVTGLRVLAVQKCAPYASRYRPAGYTPPSPDPCAWVTPSVTAGDDPSAEYGTVHMRMLWWDGKSPVDAQATPSLVWIGGCENPDGDLYYNCYSKLGSTLTQPFTCDTSANKYYGCGEQYRWAPTAGLADREQQGVSPSYGLAYVFFAACAGRLQPAAGTTSQGLPFSCVDPQGNQLGASDFVPGYTAIYAYGADAERYNENPIVKGLTLDGVALPADDAAAPHFAHCTGDCKHSLQVQVDKASAERDPNATTADGTPLYEAIWVDYYATGGDLKDGVRLVNDASTGWNDDNATDWSLPSIPGPVMLWAVVHDSRGGVTWVQRRVQID